jgi:hypothetical protein
MSGVAELALLADAAMKRGFCSDKIVSHPEQNFCVLRAQTNSVAAKSAWSTS